MVRLFDQPIRAALLISAAAHILLVGSLSLRFSFPGFSLQEQPISVKLLEIIQPQEKPVRATRERKKNQTTPPAEQESKKLSGPKPELSAPLAPPQLPDPTHSPTKPGGLETGEGQERNMALLPRSSVAVSGERGTGRGEGGSTANPGKGEKGVREARPVQTAKASYPPMALRMGLEADVELKIQVDTEGKVMKVEIVKSAGMGFDEEAVKAVRQFRFEPARKDGNNVSSEFTYIYRFRLEK